VAPGIERRVWVVLADGAYRTSLTGYARGRCDDRAVA